MSAETPQGSGCGCFRNKMEIGITSSKLGKRCGDLVQEDVDLIRSVPFGHSRPSFLARAIAISIFSQNNKTNRKKTASFSPGPNIDIGSAASFFFLTCTPRLSSRALLASTFSATSLSICQQGEEHGKNTKNGVAVANCPVVGSYI